MKERLVKGFEETTKDLFEILPLFTREEVNKIPFEGSWTAGQVAEHLYKSESNIVRTLMGNSVATERDPYEHTTVIEKIFLDYSIKLQSPDFIIPSDEPKDKDQLINNFKETRKELKELLNTLDPNRTFTDFSFPTLGHLTGWECVCFVVCHSKRHIRQMKIIAGKLKLTGTLNDAA